MGNVMAIGLTPSRTGVVIGPSRRGIVIGRLLNAQLRHMSVRAAWRHKLSLFWPQTRCRQVALYSLVVQSSLEFSLSLSFALNTLLMPVRILLSLSFQVICLSITYNDTFSAINMGL